MRIDLFSKKYFSNPPSSPFIKGGIKSLPLFYKEGVGEITKS
jgi:hypothetical protein